MPGRDFYHKKNLVVNRENGLSGEQSNALVAYTVVVTDRVDAGGLFRLR